MASLLRTVWGGSGGQAIFTTPVCAPRVYWDLDIQTNAVIKHRGPSEVLPPHPEVELLRSQLILKLRQHYRELCQQREGEGSAASPWLHTWVWVGRWPGGSGFAVGKQTCWGPSSVMWSVFLNLSAVPTPVSWGLKFLEKACLELTPPSSQEAQAGFQIPG